MYALALRWRWPLKTGQGEGQALALRWRWRHGKAEQGEGQALALRGTRNELGITVGHVAMPLARDMKPQDVVSLIANIPARER